MSLSNQQVYFHIGLPKTASTFLQVRVFPNLEGVRFFRKRLFKQYDHLIAKYPGEKLLFSSEYDRGQAEVLAEIQKKHPQARIIIVFRNHASWLASRYKYFIRKHGNLSFEAFFNLDNTGFWKIEELLYTNKIQFIRKTFDQAPLVLCFEDLQKNRAYFLNQIEQYTSSTINHSHIRKGVIKQAFSEKQLLFLRKFNRWYPYQESKHPRKWRRKLYYKYREFLLHGLAFICRFLPRTWIGEEVLIPTEQLKKIEHYFQEDWASVLKNIS